MIPDKIIFPKEMPIGSKFKVDKHPHITMIKIRSFKQDRIEKYAAFVEYGDFPKICYANHNGYLQECQVIEIL